MLGTPLILYVLFLYVLFSPLKKAPFGAISVFLAVRCVWNSALEKAPIGPEKAPISPEKA